MRFAFDPALRTRLAANLDRLAHASVDESGLKRAAVCVAVTDDGHGEAALLLTKRAARLNRHAGQYALPGGRLDEGESPLDAACREALEEIGLTLGPGDFLGRLDDFPTRSGYLITPLVAWVGTGAPLAANPAEVARIYRVPLADLEREGSPQFVAIAESDRPVIRYPILGTLVHAPTAAVMYQFMEVAVHGRPTRVAHLEQPVWAWR
ncbi:MAG TPA: CoA pyrophosphatase [Burkholderiales bacterium]|nr:CoA pyrophosphatase [Burkholderiales bacterium]